MITATNTMSQLQMKLDLIGNNIANVGTTGYKSKSGTFSELMLQQVNNQQKLTEEIGRLSPAGIHVGNGARLGLVKVNLNQGSLQTTNRDLDVALTKEDLFFKVNVDGEVQFTRDGSFYLTPSTEGDGQYQLVTSEGHYVLNENNEPIIISGTIENINITDDGTINVTTLEGLYQSIGLGVISVQNAQYLEQKSGNNVGLSRQALNNGITAADIYTDLVGNLRNDISIEQGVIEASNVDLSQEMSNLMSTQRLYQFQARSVTLADQMLGLINSVR